MLEKHLFCSAQFLSRVFSISDIPWFVEVQHHPDSLPRLVDLFDVILAGDFHNLSERVLRLGGLPLGKALLPGRGRESRQKSSSDNN